MLRLIPASLIEENDGATVGEKLVRRCACPLGGGLFEESVTTGEIALAQQIEKLRQQLDKKRVPEGIFTN
ncbi:MAG: hypothetical protein R2856_14100 [Caldilineaceae bacterium]